MNSFLRDHKEYCTNGVHLGTNQCSCLSGSTGPGCLDDKTEACAPLPSVSPLQTEAVAELMLASSFVTSDTFVFLIESPARNERYFESISLNQVPACSYPGPNFVKDFVAFPSCRDSFQGSFSIPQLVENCSFTETLGDDFLALEGKIHVTAIDPMGFFRGRQIQRMTKSVLTLNINLPTVINLETGNLTVLSPIETLLAVTFQSYDFDADQGVIQLTSSVQWPYFLQSPSLAQSAVPIGATLVSLSDLQCEQDVPDSPCSQVTTLQINNLRSGEISCSLDGMYTFDWSYGCRTGFSAPCPLDGSEVLSSNITLASEDYCSRVEVVSSLTGELKSYSDGTFTTEKIAFLAGERIYLKATLAADVTIQSILVWEVRVLMGGETYLIVENGSTASPFSVTLGYNGDEGSTNNEEQGFSFIALMGDSEQDLFQTDLFNGLFSFTVQALLDVSYQTTFGKRDILHETISLEAHLILHN